MAYTSKNFQTKKAFKEAVMRGEPITVWSTGPFAPRTNGTEHVEGPHYPQAHTWYATVTVQNGVVTKVK